MKKLIFIVLCLLIRSVVNRQVETNMTSVIKPLAELKTSIEVEVTMYYAEASQCDADPLVTAGMYRINSHKASEQKFVALSRDLLARWGGSLHYGDSIKIAGTNGKDGTYLVADAMNKRFKHRIDILETKGTEFYKFNKVIITKI